MQKGVVYWITGLAGSGKTTIGNALYYKMKKTTTVVLLDGDVLKTIVGGENPGYTKGDRLARAKRYSLLCKTLSDQGVNVIICTIAMFDEIREWNRENFAHYIEVFLDVPVEVLKRRNKKGLYMDTSVQTNVVGLHEPVEFPKNPDIVLNTDGSVSVSECVNRIQNISWKEKNEYNKDTEYWNAYYKNVSNKKESDFAREMLKYINERSTADNEKGYLLDLGCGNGRDSVFFARNEIHVIGIDASDIAIERLGEIYEHDRYLEFVCDDFVTADALFQREYDYCYSRFTLHAISAKQEKQLLSNVYKTLKKDGLFMIEARTIHDSIYAMGDLVERNAYIYNDHYRRFIDPDELIQKVKEIGFQVIFCKEGQGFSKTATEDPVLVRLVVKK